MRDIAFFSKLLALKKPWRVERVSLDTHEHQIDVWLAHRRNATFTCPECDRRIPLYDHVPSRSWRHLNHGDCLTWLHSAWVIRLGHRQLPPGITPQTAFAMLHEAFMDEILRSFMPL